MKLNIEQSEMLFEIAEIHMNWIHKYNKESTTTFKEILEINHNKLLNYFADSIFNEKAVTKKLLKMKARVLGLSNEY